MPEDRHAVPVELDRLVHIYPPRLLGGGHAHALEGSDVDDAAEAAELEFGGDFEDSDGVVD